MDKLSPRILIKYKAEVYLLKTTVSKAIQIIFFFCKPFF